VFKTSTGAREYGGTTVTLPPAELRPAQVPDSVADRERVNCRGCETASLQRVLDLGSLSCADFADPHDRLPEPQARLELMLCSRCGLLQLRHTTVSDSLYSTRWCNQREPAEKNMAALAARVSEFTELSPGDAILDISSPCAKVAQFFASPGIRRISFDPAALGSGAMTGLDGAVAEFFRQDRIAGERFRIVTSIGIFDEFDDPSQFAWDVARLLTADGVWAIQVPYLPLLLAGHEVDAMGPRHLAYYSLNSLELLLGRHGLAIADVETSDTGRGLLRVFAVPENSASRNVAGRERVRAMRAWEASLKLDLPPTYEKFGQQIANIGALLSAWVRRERAHQRTVSAYGCSDGGNMLLHMFGLDRSLLHVLGDDHPGNYGMLAAGNGIPIVSLDQAMRESDSLVVLPWYRFSEIHKRATGFVERGGQLIKPLPYPQVQDSSGIRDIK
jgi:NDP-4-keto-2,6-dideoxyhexose 3-C-methyltransferase